MRFTEHPTEHPNRRLATRLLLGLAIAGGIALLASQASGVPAGNEVDWLSRLARSGDAGAQLQLGLAYLDGRYGIQPDAATGRYWLSAAAEGGNAYAADAVANSYARDSAEPQQKALPWWQIGARGGNADAQLHLGEILLSRGHDQQALTWLRDAADQGDQRAHAELASLYPEIPLTEADLYRGENRLAAVGERIGSPSIKSLFAVWNALQLGSPLNQTTEALLEHAKQGDPVAEYQLAVRYMDGAWAVERDPQKAMSWLQRAAAAGNPQAEKNLAELRSKKTMSNAAAPPADGDGRA